MGALPSACKNSPSDECEKAWSWNGPPGDHSPYPLDLVPYPGPDLLYCFIDIMTSFKILRNTINLGHQVATSNVDDFMKEFEDCYKEDFQLLKFVKIPGVKNTMCVQDWSEKQPYQAIFCKPTTTPKGSDERWQLQIEKRILSTKTLSTADEGAESDLTAVIHKLAAKGARLRCVNPVGYVRSATTNQQYSVLGVDLFFDLALHPKPKVFTYHAVRYPTHYVSVPDPTKSVQQIDCDADWMGQFKEFLDQGWKLIDICIDSTSIADAFRAMKPSTTVDAIWLFEKDSSKLEDLSPAYEGAIIEYKHKVKTTLEGEMPCRDWRAVVAGMGAAGWELATMVQTPALVQSSFSTYSMKLLFFFQRPIIEEHMKRTVALRKQQEMREERRKTFHAGHYSSPKTKPALAFGTASNPMVPRRIRDPPPQERYYNHQLQRFVPVANAVPAAAAAAAAAVGAVGLPNGDIPGRWNQGPIHGALEREIRRENLLAQQRPLGDGEYVRFPLEDDR